MRRAGIAMLLAIGCERAAPPAPTAPAADVPVAPVAPADVPPPPPARRTLTAHARGASTDPPLREFDPRMEVPRWAGEGTLEVVLPSGDGPVSGALRAGDLSLRVRGFRAGERVRGTLEPEAVDVDAGAPVWRGTLDLTLAGDSLSGAWTASAEAGRLARAGTVGPR